MARINSVEAIKSAIRSAARPLVRLSRALLEPTPVRVVTDWCTIESGPAAGCELLLPRPSSIAERIVSGSYEHLCTRIIEALVTPGTACFDIGGHYGYFSLLLGRLAGPGAVHVFEPVPQHAERIRQAAKRSGLTQLTVHPVALADSEGEMQLRVAGDQGDDSMAYLEAYGGVISEAAHEQYPSFNQLSVRTQTLDNLRDHRPGFIKMDAEGAEAPILRGGRQLLKQANVRLLVEVHGIRQALECAEILRPAGYQAVVFDDQALTMPVLWVRTSDAAAVKAVEHVLGHPPLVLGGE